MQQTDNIDPVSEASSVFARVIGFFGRSRVPTSRSHSVPAKIDWRDSDFERRQPYNGNDNQPISGGYNEAYIVQHWVSYHLR